MATDIQTALANEARRQELRAKIANLTGAIGATASVINKLSSVNSDTTVMLTEAKSQLTTLEAGAGPGITDDFGEKSTITQLLEAERAAAKSAAIDFVKGNPNATEDQAADAWNQAAIATHPYLQLPLQPGIAMGRLFRVNLLKMNLIASDTWEAQRAWILATSKDAILAI
jgi:hypothetical protein